MTGRATLFAFGDYRDGLTCDEYRKVAAAYDHITSRVAELLDLGQVERARAALLINPWPLDPAALAGLRALTQELTEE